MVGVRQRMTMLCYPERNTSSGSDTWNNPIAPTWTVQSSIPCYAWADKSQEAGNLRRDINKTAYVMIIPKSADLIESDRVQKITDRLGVQIYGAMRIQSITRIKDYKEVRMTEYE